MKFYLSSTYITKPYVSPVIIAEKDGKFYPFGQVEDNVDKARMIEFGFLTGGRFFDDPNLTELPSDAVELEIS